MKKWIHQIIHKLRASLAANIIGAIVLVLAVFGLIVSILGFISFSRAFKKEYAVTTYHMADTATTLIKGDHLEAYLAGEEPIEYRQTKEALTAYCRKISVSMIYVIRVDQSDYGRFVSIFNPVDNRVDNSSYVEWELGHKRDTTNDEYRRKYRAIYEEGSAYETVYRIKTTDGQHPHITTMVPVKGTAGDVTAILCIQRPFRELREVEETYIESIAVSTALLALIASVFAASVIRRRFVGPIKKVSDEAARFARENTKGLELGRISSYEEISELARSIDTMETDMVSYIDHLTEITAEKERIEAELSLASTIQKNAIPNDFPAFPERKDFDIYASMVPAREVGGDFYNFYLIDDDHLALAIGDVSGKGIPAALFMMLINNLIMDRTDRGGSPAEILSSINESVCVRNTADMFVTVWLGILELSTGRLTAANAGHSRPAIRRADGSFALFNDPHGLVVGAMEGVRYKDYELQFTPGDTIFVYTDGVEEASDGDYAMFGKARLVAALNQEADADPKRILHNVRRAVDDFVKDAEQFDDMTMLCLTYLGK